MTTFPVLRADLQANQGSNTKSRIVVSLFRCVQGCAHLWGDRSIFTLAVRVIYQFIVEWFLGIEIPWNAKIGPGLRLLHGVALVVNAEATLGSGCTLRHATTIGNKILADGTASGSPQIGNNVDIGSNVTILGPITIGDGAVIGAGAVVTKDVQAYTVVVGNPARLLRKLDPPAEDGESSPLASELISL
ncbi:MAG: serine acetyltransferase [Synechococcales cyanobacterium RM1_1_8]|nr:serine acetyltransferase [Synechococcales cyanobacterium RM1_1_8]